MHLVQDLQQSQLNCANKINKAFVRDFPQKGSCQMVVCCDCECPYLGSPSQKQIGSLHQTWETSVESPYLCSLHQTVRLLTGSKWARRQKKDSGSTWWNILLSQYGSWVIMPKYAKHTVRMWAGLLVEMARFQKYWQRSSDMCLDCHACDCFTGWNASCGNLETGGMKKREWPSIVCWGIPAWMQRWVRDRQFHSNSFKFHRLVLWYCSLNWH